MPLTLLTIACCLLFFFEALDHMSRRADAQDALRRYYRAEHSQRHRSDSYLDTLR